MTDEEKRITVGVIRKTEAALDHLCELLEMGCSDVINRAVQFYEFAETSTHPLGSYLAVVNPDGTLERVRWS